MSASFQKVLSMNAKDPLVRFLQLEYENQVSHLFEKSDLQDSFRFRSQFYAKLFSDALFDTQERIAKDRIDTFLKLFQTHAFIIGPNKGDDDWIFRHIKQVFKYLSKSEKTIKFFDKFRLPLCHKKAEELIRQTLNLQEQEKLTHLHIKKAVLSSWLTPLRQSVGSCFATAPAILIQADQPEKFLQDLLDLLNSGKLTRTFEGVEYTVPLCYSWGLADSTKPFVSRNVFENPALINAFESVYLIDSLLSIKEKVAVCQKIIAPFLQTGSQNAQKLIREILLQKHTVSEKEIEREKRFEKTKEMTQGFHQMRFVALPVSESAKKVQAFQKDFQTALGSFKKMTENPLLKSWEFTLASFTDVKLTFASWNLYSSLGLDPEKADGLGKFLTHFIQQKMDYYYKQAEDLQQDYQRAYDQAIMTEALIRNSGNQMQRRNLKAEHQRAVLSMQSLLNTRDAKQGLAEEYQMLFPYLIEEYIKYFPEHFQEVFDPEMHQAEKNYEDSPAGFRLIYKHGRSDPSVWTYIQNETQYRDCLREFFTNIERQVFENCPYENAKNDLTEITTKVVLYIRSDEFLEGAVDRIANTNTKSDSTKKPWSYISGGTMDTLLKAYYRIKYLTVEKKTISSEKNLLTFFQEIAFSEEKADKMLAFSPTHAFTFYPSLFRKTYTTDFLEKLRSFYSSIQFDANEQTFLLQEFCKKYPYIQKKLHFSSVSHRPLSFLSEFRKECIDALHMYTKGKIDVVKMVDQFLFSALPLQKQTSFKRNISLLFENMDLPSEEKKIAFKKIALLNFKEPFATSHTLYRTAVDILLEVKKHCFTPSDDLLKLTTLGKTLGVFAPNGPLVADTNWPRLFFGFLVNLSDFNPELWVFDRLGMNGSSMSDWKKWFDSTNQGIWGIYTNPSEYSF